MKANQKIKNMKADKTAQIQVVGGLVALLLMIIIGVMIYWETQGAIDAFDEQEETFTSESDGTSFSSLVTNGTAWSIDLDNSPASAGVTNITCLNTTTHTVSHPTFTLSHKIVSVAADAADYFNQVNATYTSNMAGSEDETSAMATTVFDLLPIIALAVVASIIIGVIIGFGGSIGGKI